MAAEEVVEVRCPLPQLRADGTCHPGALLLKLRRAGEHETYVHPDNLMELRCEDCTKKLRRQGRRIKRVLHRYNFIGEHVETLIVE